jgi:hypothetical protein
MGWSRVRSKQLKMVAAGIGVGAVVVMAALGVALSEGPAASVISEPEPTIGETVTSTTAPTEIETSVATPTVTASTPEGFGP